MPVACILLVVVAPNGVGNRCRCKRLGEKSPQLAVIGSFLGLVTGTSLVASLCWSGHTQMVTFKRNMSQNHVK